MLVLSRRKDESIVIRLADSEEVVTVSVVDIDRNKVRIGIEASKQVAIWRQEIYTGQGVSGAKPSVQ